jgi:Zn-dependent peptidase ImmA (M78 family)
VSYWEAGKRAPGLDDLIDLSFELGQEIDYFLPPDRTRQPVAAMLRAEAARLASTEMQALVEDLLSAADGADVPEAEIEVGGRQPSHAANELLEKAGISTAPIPVHELAARCGVLVLTHSFPDALSGLVIELDAGAIIGVNAQHAHVRQRFTTAHELGHHLLGHAERFHIDVTDGHQPGYDYRSERAANDFAAELLMPRRILAREFKLDDRTPILANAFEVSEIAMGYRLVNLGLR